MPHDAHIEKQIIAGIMNGIFSVLKRPEYLNAPKARTSAEAVQFIDGVFNALIALFPPSPSGMAATGALLKEIYHDRDPLLLYIQPKLFENGIPDDPRYLGLPAGTHRYSFGLNLVDLDSSTKRAAYSIVVDSEIAERSRAAGQSDKLPVMMRRIMIGETIPFLSTHKTCIDTVGVDAYLDRSEKAVGEISIGQNLLGAVLKKYMMDRVDPSVLEADINSLSPALRAALTSMVVEELKNPMKYFTSFSNFDHAIRARLIPEFAQVGDDFATIYDGRNTGNPGGGNPGGGGPGGGKNTFHR